MATHTEEESIPQDITIQIFSWLPIKSLMRFRCVSKFYNSLVLEPNFADLHSWNYSKFNRGDTKLIACVNKDVCYAIEDDGNSTKYYQIENFTNKLYDHIEGHRFASDNGLLCIWDVNFFAICNPTTREVRFLPDVPREEFKCFIGFEPEENKYKIILIFDNNYNELSRAWVFTLDEHGYCIASYRSGICISGIIYLFSYAPDFCIVAFDVKSEIFTSITMSIELANSLHKCKYDFMLIEVDGKLGILNLVGFWYSGDTRLWIFGEQVWEHDDIIYLSPYMICNYHGKEIVFAMHKTSSDVLVFSFYDVKNKSWRHIEVQEELFLLILKVSSLWKMLPLLITNHNYNTI